MKKLQLAGNSQLPNLHDLYGSKNEVSLSLDIAWPDISTTVLITLEVYSQINHWRATIILSRVTSRKYTVMKL